MLMPGVRFTVINAGERWGVRFEHTENGEPREDYRPIDYWLDYGATETDAKKFCDSLHETVLEHIHERTGALRMMRQHREETP